MLQSNPLINGPQKEALARRTLLGVFVAIMVPWCTFLILMCLFVVIYHSAPIVMNVLVSLALLCCVVGLVLSHRALLHSRVRLFSSTALAVLLASGCGYYNYSAHVVEFYAFDERQHYTNVSPEEPAAAHADASVIVFSTGTKPDLSKTAALTSRTHTYCVAPVTMLGQVPPVPVQYWAAGLDCCKTRDTYSCGDVHVASARSGLVIMNISNGLHAILTQDLDRYRMAAHLAAASYGLVSAEPPIFLHWTYDVVSANYTHLYAAWLFCLETILLHLIISVCVECIMIQSQMLSMLKLVCWEPVRVRFDRNRS